MPNMFPMPSGTRPAGWLLMWLSCMTQAGSPISGMQQAYAPPEIAQTIHVMVALCDNQYQGIVKVPSSIGNGQRPDQNLYWGCGYGIRTFFNKSRSWSLIGTRPGGGHILERVIFRHKTYPWYLVADAYDGQYIRTCTEDFLRSTAGQLQDTLQVSDHVLGLRGHARLLAYIGHNGLMDFSLPDTYQQADTVTRDCIILACISQTYFRSYMQSAGSRPLVWTTGLMCPEAYTLHDALEGYVRQETPEQIRSRAARAYAYYQKCSEKAARNLLVTGWWE